MERQMRFTDALKILQSAPKEGKPFEVTLACGFTPLHLQTFLAAYIQQAMPSCRVSVSAGLYGSIAATIEEASVRRAANLAIAIEWTDLDARLGYRASAVWDTNALSDILLCTRKAFERLAIFVQGIPSGTKVAISLPTLPIPPLFHSAGWQLSESESLLGIMAAEFAGKMASSGTSVVNSSYLSVESPPGERFDLKSDLLLGLPYTQTHVERLAQALSRLLCPPIPKKGIITDLDDTLWSGLVGEVGPNSIHWDLDNHSGLHGLYQSLLASFADHGILVGVASKNDASVVEKAFARPDLLLRNDRVFPMEVHWQAKSSSVERILRTWNISPDAVVFVDDSPSELAEVAEAHPGIECIRFPGKDYAAGYAMFRRLRNLFGKERISNEDRIRLDSIRQSVDFQKAVEESSPESFLREAKAEIHFDFECSTDARALELVNKTNQFNLNGIRHTASEWSTEVSLPCTELIVISYQDRFGLLGKIAVLLGNVDGPTLRIRTWVMSCRAFSRRIEHQCLKVCFDRFGVCQIEFEFLPTERNGPLQNFLETITGEKLNRSVKLTKERFDEICPSLYHTIKDSRSQITNG
jgi:FkbH-like protein